MKVFSRLLVLSALLSTIAGPSVGQQVCRGDVDGDGSVTFADIGPLLPILFDPEGIDPVVVATADVNEDGTVTAADAVGVLLLDGFPCPGGAATPTRTPSRTRTVGATVSPTPSRTPSVTPTSGPSCVVQAASLGTTAGTLTDLDCEIEVDRELRFADQYAVVVGPGQAVKIEVAATGFTPLVRVVDPGGLFETVAGTPPVEVQITSGNPYTIFVSSDPDSTSETGAYSMTLTARPCVAVALANSVFRSFDGSECPDPSFPTVDDRVELADTYTFAVSAPLTLVSIAMEQSREDSLVDPMFAIFGPAGYEVFPSFQADDLAATGFGFDAAARFLATEVGTYTMIATSGGCDPEDEFGCNYRTRFSTATCPVTALTNIPSTVRQAVPGIHWGDQRRTRCSAPLPIPGDEFDIPEVSSPADVYSFQGVAGEVITVEMDSEDEGQLYLYAPTEFGQRLIAADGDISGDLLAQIGVVLPHTGTYTLVAANKNYLFPPDPEDPEDEGDFSEYTLFLQKCPVNGAISLAGSGMRSDTFSAIDCVAPGGVPVRSYALTLSAGTYLDATMTSSGFDASLTLVGPDGSRIGNDNDPFTPGTSNARVGRIVPLSGTYYLEASAPLSADLGGTLNFTLRAQTCPTRAIAPGLIDGTFAEGDCDLGDGRRYDVLTFDAPVDAAQAPRIAGMVPDAGMCARPLLPFAVPALPVECAPLPVEVPLARTGRNGWIVAGATPVQRGAYSIDFVQCPAALAGFGVATSGQLETSDCADAAGRPADWFLLRGNAGSLRFNDGAAGTLSSNFAERFSVAGADGPADLARRFLLGVESFYLLGDDLGTVLKLRGMTLAEQGSYSLSVDALNRRQ